jgi:tRNA (guanine-N7-)-methyltransferase
MTERRGPDEAGEAGKSRPAFLANYLANLCAENKRRLDSPFVWHFEPDDLPLAPRRLLAGCDRLFLEIGFGHGEVLEQLCQRHPEIGFVGIERRPARVRRTLKRLHRIKADNCRLIRANLELIEGPLFAPESFDEILINHPDPWPKRRHGHHRFFQPRALDWLCHLLSPKGYVEVASDQAEYFFSILRLFEKDERWISDLPAPFYTRDPLPHRALSRFERRVRAAGQPVRILRVRKS